MANEIYKTLYYDGARVTFADETEGFTVMFDENHFNQYYVNYNDSEATIDQIIDGEKEYYDTVEIRDLPYGDCIEDKIAKYLLG